MESSKSPSRIRRSRAGLFLCSLAAVTGVVLYRSNVSLLAIDWQPGEDAAGQVLLTLAGDGAIRLSVEALELRLRDVTRPYLAPSRKAPDHGA